MNFYKLKNAVVSLFILLGCLVTLTIILVAVVSEILVALTILALVAKFLGFHPVSYVLLSGVVS